ncbi:PRC-barrel domain-containing protein [Actinoplanes sp. NPDC026619]|uniref:PRC-barrel domain-containing protein n=1 Tax=Actinoplanes sp. NPDC026619 TaxID=3155798 RepID=UPI0033E8A2E5
MLFSALLHRRILAAGCPSALGRVDNLVIDPQTTRIVALCVADGPSGGVVHWADVAAFSPYAVMVRNRWSVGPPDGRAAELIESDQQLLGKRLLTDAGEQIGRLTDVDFDPLTGEVTRLIASDGPVRGQFLLAEHG